MKYLLLILMFVSMNSYGETYLTLNLASKHFSADKYNYNEENFGIGLNYNNYLIGQYKNSFNKNSVYAGYQLQKRVNKHLAYGLKAGLVTGYTDEEMESVDIGGAKLFAIPQMSIGYKNINYLIGVIPVDNGVMTFQLEIKL